MFATVPMSRLVQEGYVALHPEAARERVSARYSCELTQSGRESAGIAMLRDLIHSVDCDIRFARSLFITAAHTHWGDRDIVISFDPERNVFLSGPTVSGGALYPFSFVFSADGPIPYEWADETVPVTKTDLDEIYAFINQLNAAVVKNVARVLPIPLGIAINHRFKRSVWDEQVFSFAEGPHDEENGRAVIRPVVESVVERESRYPNQVQVAWSAFPNDSFIRPDLTIEEAAVYRRLEDLLRDMRPQEGVAFMEDLHVYLNMPPS